MAKSRTRTSLITARSEQRKGFTMPTQKRIKSALRKRSKEFIINLFMMAFGKLTKTQKISMLMRIQAGKLTKSMRKRAGKVRKRSKSRRGTGFQGKVRGSKAEKRAQAKARRARKSKSRR